MKKKVLFFTTSGDYNGGGVMCLIETLKYIDKTKIEPYVIIPTHGTTEDKLKELNIKYSIIRCYDWLFSKKIINSLPFKMKFLLRIFMNTIAEIRFLFLFKKLRIEAYHLNSIYSNCGVWSATKLNIPIFWHLREFVDDNSWTSAFLNEKKSYKIIEKVYLLIAVSNSIKKFYQKKMPSANIIVAYDGIDNVNSFEIRNTIKFNNPLRLSMIGGVTEVKGHEDAIYAVKELIQRGISCHLSIYGRIRDKQYYNKLIKLISLLSLQDIITFEGNKTDMENVWKQTDIVLVCSKSESFGRVAIESMYQNIPVIGADNSGTAELIVQGTISAKYETGNPSSLCKEIISITKKSFDEKILLKNHEYAASFSSKANADILTKLFLQ